MDINLGFTVHLPSDITFLKTMTFVGAFSLAMFMIALLSRLLLGKESSLKYSLSSALSVIMLYALCVVIYTFSPRDFTHYLNQLGLGVFSETTQGEKVFALICMQGLDLPGLCYRLLRIYMLCVLVNLVNSYTPKDMKLLGWILFRLFFLATAIGINYALFKVIDMFIPFVFKSYIPMLLLTILAFSFFLGFVKFLLALLLTKVNPAFGAFYTFFFVNKFGKSMSRAIGSTIVVAALIIIFERLGYGTIPVSAEVLSSYVPFGISMFILWIIVGRLL